MATATARKIGGGVVMLLLLVGAVAVAALPLVVGLVAGAYLPDGVGGLRTEGGPARMLHLLWVYPVLWVAALVVDALVKYVTFGRRPGPVALAVEVLVMWVVLTLLYGVFFERVQGAALAAAVALLVLVPFVRLLEKGAEDDEPDDGAGGAHEDDGGLSASSS